MKKTTVQIVVLTLIAVLVVVCGQHFYELSKPKELPPMTVAEKKERFIELLVPAVDKVYHQLLAEYERGEMLLNSRDAKAQAELTALKHKYRAKTDAELLTALKPHPKSITLAQAAMESSWATSRFFLAAKNVFGVWSFDKHEERIAALEKRGNKTVWVRKYPTVEASIKDYYRTLARGVAFSEFRKLKMKTDDPFELVKKLDRYSEKGAAYVKELAAVIRHNNFTDYDD